MISFCISVFIAIVSGILLNYCFLPAWNIRSAGLWGFIFVLLFIFGVAYIISESLRGKENKKTFMIGCAPMSICLLAMVICAVPGMKIFNASNYSSVVEITTGNWNEDIEAVSSIDNIALMDTDTAAVFGERKLGSLSDIVSQYILSENYTQMNYSGSPMKVAPLEYASFWKWIANKKVGIPGYIMVDPVNTEAKFVRLENGIKYSPADMFSRDLSRVLRKEYPTYIFGDSYFEIDDDGNPYWVTSVQKPSIGVFSGKEIQGAVVLDACTGESQYYKTSEIPEWVDVVYDGDYICERVNWNGMLKNGFWNSVFSAKGCTQCTDDYGYVTIDSDIWVYTGITSATSDSSNIGVILANERTGEIKYYEIAGADEASAMEAAEGEVANYGYTASFPSIINVNGEPTYIMVLKDANNIVKEYAMVNVANYSKVVIAETQEEVFSKYANKMGFTDLAEDADSNSDDNTLSEDVTLTDVNFTINDMKFIVNDGDTTVYIYASDNKVYKSKFDEFWILAKAGDNVQAKCDETKSNDSIIEIVEFE